MRAAHTDKNQAWICPINASDGSEKWMKRERAAKPSWGGAAPLGAGLLAGVAAGQAGKGTSLTEPRVSSASASPRSK